MAHTTLSSGAKMAVAGLIGASTGATWYFYATNSILATAVCAGVAVYWIAFSWMFRD